MFTLKPYVVTEVLISMTAFTYTHSMYVYMCEYPYIWIYMCVCVSLFLLSSKILPPNGDRQNYIK